MQVGLGRLGLSPRHFWSMTPRELGAAITGAFGTLAPPPMSRSILGRLLADFPDTSSPSPSARSDRE
jgi:uncharacterized phage protein (TIGR02216 family)